MKKLFEITLAVSIFVLIETLFGILFAEMLGGINSNERIIIYSFVLAIPFASFVWCISIGKIMDYLTNSESYFE